MKEEYTYKNIFKATALFGSVQVITIIINVIKNKVVAFLLGTSGVGIIGLFTSSFTLIQSLAGLGISQSSVRYLSEVNGKNDKIQISKTILIIRRLLWFTSLLGAVITIIFSKWLSIWTFGSEKYTFAYLLLSIVVFLNIFNLGQLAILQGMRMLKPLAKSSVFGGIAGLITSLPLFYFLGEGGIVPSLITTGLSAVIISRFYLNKVKVEIINIDIKRTVNGSIKMMKLGMSLMVMSFITSGVGLVLRTYISNHGSVDQVGVFQAGYTIIHSYFGLIFTAMMKDYFPRLSSINKDNQLITQAVNQQAIVALILIGPLVVLLLFISPILIQILYTNNFIEAVGFIDFAIFGVLFMAGSQTMGLILIAKNRSDIFIISVLVLQTFFLINNLIFYSYFGIQGLGLSFAINMLVDLIFIQIIIKRIFNIRFKKQFYSILLINLLICTLSFFTKNIEHFWLKYAIGLILFVFSLYISLKMFKSIMKISSVIEILKNMFYKNKYK